MFGIEILDVVIGLIFVYLLLSLLASALNEYITAVLNLRGKELARGLGRLLDDMDEKDALQRAFQGVAPRVRAGRASLARRIATWVSNTRLAAGVGKARRAVGGWLWGKAEPIDNSITQRFYNHHLIRPLATRRGWLFRGFSKEPRLPSYIPARTFALALLDVLDVRNDDDVRWLAAASQAGSPPFETMDLQGVLGILQRESPLDVNEHLKDLSGWLGNANLPEPVKLRLLDSVTNSQTELQKLHDSVEVWFNHSMDRVSGAYKRAVQGWLFVIGVLIASCLNADTIDMWRRLSENDEVREGMAARAVASLAVLDSVARPPLRTDTATPPATIDSAQVQRGSGTPPQTTPPANAADTTKPRTPLDSARLNYQTARARLDSLELRLGWTRGNLQTIGLLDTARARRDSAARVRLSSRDTARANATLARLRAGLAGVQTEPAKQVLRDSITAAVKDSAAAARAAAAATERHWRDGLNLGAPRTHPAAFWTKVLGLLMTALAISLGAPFWFDLLNKVISIRAAGRSPEEKAKSPAGPPKRAAEHTPM